MSNLLALENLQTTFRTREGEVHAVRGVSFQVQPGELVDYPASGEQRTDNRRQHPLPE